MSGSAAVPGPRRSERGDRAPRATPRLAASRPALALLSLLAVTRPGPAAGAAPYETAACERCHASLLAGKEKHAVSDDCASCHLAVGKRGMCKSGIAGRWRLAAPEPGLCASCHDEGSGARPHTAIARGGCTSCHDAHSSEHPKLLARWPAAELCASCHGRKDGTKNVHTAVREADCLGCHDPHASAHPALLRAANDARLCFRCHEDDATGRTSVHRPVAEGSCGKCHVPHGSDHAGNLRAPVEPTCAACHPRIEAGKTRHAALDAGGCTTCHDPHGSEHRALLVDEVNPLCTQCHRDQASGRHVTSFAPGGHRVSGVLDPHAPERELSCASCHAPHASESPKLLRYGKSPMQFCDWCHGDRSGEHPELRDIHRVKRSGKAAGPPPTPASPVGPTTTE